MTTPFNLPMAQLTSAHPCFGGVQSFYSFESKETGLPMRFSVFMPPAVQSDSVMAGKVPLLVYLAGLTSTEETFAIKAGAQKYAAQQGLALLSIDTSPRGANVPGEADSWDFGVGAGFYLDATQAPWSAHWRMQSCLLNEVLPLAVHLLPIDAQRIGICGHSMGGHGALTLGLKFPEIFKSLSALAPICAPSQCAWGRKALTGYLGAAAEHLAGADAASWAAHDAVQLLLQQASLGKAALFAGGILVDQGMADKFLPEGQLHPELLEAACQQAHQPLNLRRHADYDHGYYFVATFIADHIAHHAKILLQK